METEEGVFWWRNFPSIARVQKYVALMRFLRLQGLLLFSFPGKKTSCIVVGAKNGTSYIYARKRVGYNSYTILYIFFCDSMTIVLFVFLPQNIVKD